MRNELQSLVEKSDVMGLIKLLDNNQPHYIMIDVAEILGKFGDKRAVQPLINCLNHENADVRRYSAAALGKIGDPKAIDPIINLLNDDDVWVSDAASSAISQFRTIAIERLIIRLQEKTIHLKDSSHVFEVIGTLAVPTLIQYAESDYVHVRRYSLEALWRIGDERAIPIFGASVYDDDKDVRRYSFNGLEKAGGLAVEQLSKIALQKTHYKTKEYYQAKLLKWVVKGVTKIRGALMEDWAIEFSTNDMNVRKQAIEVLGTLKDNSVFELLISLLLDPDWTVRKASAIALGEINDPRGVESLISLFADKNGEVRLSAFKAIEKLGKDAIPSLLFAARHSDGKMRVGAALALGGIGDESSLPSLYALALDKNWRVRSAIAANLYKFQENLIIPLLSRLQKDKRVKVRRAVAFSLAEIQSKEIFNLILSASQDKNSSNRYVAMLIVFRTFDLIGHFNAYKILLMGMRDRNFKVRKISWDVFDEVLPRTEMVYDENEFQEAVKMLEDKKWLVRLVGLRFLRQIKDSRIIEPILNAQNDKSWKVRKEFVWAIGRNRKLIGEKVVLKLLRDRQTDKNKIVRWAVNHVFEMYEEEMRNPAKFSA